MMKKCPECGKKKFVVEGFHGHCEECGFEMTTTGKTTPFPPKPANFKKCPFCGNKSVIDGHCLTCGASESPFHL